MLDDDAGRLVEILDALQRGVGVGHIVIGQFLALNLPGGGDAGFGRVGLHVERCLLVRVFAVAHFLHLVELGVEGARKAVRAAGYQLAKVVGNGTVVGRGVLVGLDGQVEAGRQGGSAIVGSHFLKDAS